MSSFDFRIELGLDSEYVLKHLQDNLIRPVEDIWTRPSKKFRAELVEKGYLLCAHEISSVENKLKGLSQLIEEIHTGSLIIDDIEDSTKIRRGAPSIHEIYGLPLALNAGNWLYFSPLSKLKDLELSTSQELQLYRLIHHTLVQCHYGQALDLGVNVTLLNKGELIDVCDSALRLKSGSLTSLALQLGAIIADANQDFLNELSRVGRELGFCLQMFDDIGILMLPKEHQKRFEDLSLKRPSWIWRVIASEFDNRQFEFAKNFFDRNPSVDEIEFWLSEYAVAETAKAQAKLFMGHTIETFKGRFESLVKLLERISHAYT
ncbi:MAG: polyprenyl synthetase family protein [Bacteriovoracia bacterium]